MILLDASVLIAYLDAEDGHHERAASLLAEHVDEQLAVNVLSLAEVFVGAVRRRRAMVVEDIVEDLAIRSVAIPADAALRLAELRASTGLPMPDCCVLLAAVDEDAAVATFDRRLATAVVRAGRRAVA